ncbi:hypothetical protein D3C85_1714890 [compost metagenome]
MWDDNHFLACGIKARSMQRMTSDDVYVFRQIFFKSQDLRMFYRGLSGYDSPIFGRAAIHGQYLLNLLRFHGIENHITDPGHFFSIRKNGNPIGI